MRRFIPFGRWNVAIVVEGGRGTPVLYESVY
jgi:hypothetical protein